MSWEVCNLWVVLTHHFEDWGELSHTTVVGVFPNKEEAENWAIDNLTFYEVQPVKDHNDL